MKNFKIGDKVTVVSNNVKNIKGGEIKDIFINETAKIEEILDDSILDKMPKEFRDYIYLLQFDNKELEEGSKLLGGILWSDSELKLNIKPIYCVPNKEKRIVDDGVVIINYPAIIYLLEHNNRVFKGVAKLHPSDIYNEKKGIAIAKLKALIKVKEYEMKINNEMIKITNNMNDKIEKDISSLKKSLSKYSDN